MFSLFLSKRKHTRFLTIVGIIIVLFTTRALAFHIVGGEIELIHLDGFNYRINVIQYFDRAQTFNQGPEAQIFVFTYRNSDRELMRIDTLLLTRQEPVLYTKPDCAIAQLSTEKVLFTKDITLDPDQFDDPEGYFLVWERCCRNASVVNISNPLSTGMTYAVEFPPIIKDGVPFVNSSPSLFPPLSDFACVGELYYADFAGVDLDGDSLAYSLTEPLNSSSTVALPIPQYPDSNRKVVWMPGISNQNIIPGVPSLNISNAGFITVRPEDPGLYVFAALAEEFRDGVKIGETRRDFQLLVIDSCVPGNAPVVRATRPDNGLDYFEGQVISFTADELKCFNFFVQDNDGEENVTLKALGVNFDQDASEVFSVNTVTLSGGNELAVEVCIPDCPFIPGQNFLIDFIAMDDACPLPRMDTLRMSFFVEPPPNQLPMFEDPDKLVEIFINEGETTSTLISGVDADGDTLDLKILNDGFDPAQFGMAFSPVTSTDGTIAIIHDLDGNCLTHDFGVQNMFQLQLALEDRDECMFPTADLLNLNVTVDLPPNTDPVVSTTNGQNIIELTLGELIDFEVNAIDADGDTIKLDAFGEGFNLDDLDIQFLPDSGRSTASSSFAWQFNCGSVDLTEVEEFTVNFVATDQDKCKVPNADTLSVVFRLIFPFNSPPVISGDNQGAMIEEGDVIDVKVLAPLELPIVGSDADGDGMTLSLLVGPALPSSENFEFETIDGSSEVTSIVNWTPACSLLNNDGSPREFEVSFLLQDNSCPEPKSDTLSVTLRIFDTPVTFDQFEPPNVITPNGDEMNDVFSLSGNDTPSFNLPPDSCDDIFQNVTIVNRYGKPVFESSDRNFVWDANENTQGTYYYNVAYSNSEFRGTLTLVD